MRSDRRFVLCLDFDGVLHSYLSGWKGARNIPDPPVPGALSFLVQAVEHFDVAIHSSRARYWGGRSAMKRWLRYWIEDELWRRPATSPGFVDVEAEAKRFVNHRLKFPLWKPPAHVTIDDRAITFTGTWPEMEDLLGFKPWNRRPRPANPAPRTDEVFLRGRAWLDKGGDE